MCMNREEWLILGITKPVMERKGMRARRERATFFTILPAFTVHLSPRP